MADTTRPSATPQTPAVTSSFFSISAAVAPEWRAPRGHQPLHKTQLVRHLFSISAAVEPEWRAPRGHQALHKHQLFLHPLSLSEAVAPDWWAPGGHQPLHKHHLTYDGFNNAQTVTKTRNLEILALKI